MGPGIARALRQITVLGENICVFRPDNEVLSQMMLGDVEHVSEEDRIT